MISPRARVLSEGVSTLSRVGHTFFSRTDPRRLPLAGGSGRRYHVLSSNHSVAVRNSVAHAVFPRGNVFMQVRDTLGVIYTDDAFADLFPTGTLRSWI